VKRLKLIINVVLVSLVCICTYKVLDRNVKYEKANKMYENIRAEKEYIQENIGQESFQIDYEDYRGWIKINTTNIDYPMVQGKDNSYYLNRNIEGEYVIAGSIFMNYTNNGFSDKNTILFGHNMKDGTMFADLNKYKQKDFFYGDYIIEVETYNGDQLKYEVFSVYTTDVKDHYIIPNFDSNNEYKQFLNKIKDKSMYQSDIEIGVADKIITLSTCATNFTDKRLVIHGKLKT